MQTRIALVTNFDERCGNAQYGRDFARHLPSFTGVEGVDSFPHCRNVLSHMGSAVSRKYRVAVINWHPARVEISTPLVHALRSAGLKVVLILQNSFDWQHSVGSDDLLAQCDAVVAHEPMDILYDGQPAKNFHYIPHGIVLKSAVTYGIEEAITHCIGTAGWPFSWKRPDVVARAAFHCSLPAKIFCPEYPGFTWPTAEWVRMAGGNAYMIQEWMLEAAVVKILSSCKFNIFWFQSQNVEDQFGQSGSVRLGVAARRPMIISRHRKFKMLLAEYPEEFYVADTEEEVYTLAKQLSTDIDAGREVRVPMKCVIKQNWWRAAERYWEVIQSLCN